MKNIYTKLSLVALGLSTSLYSQADVRINGFANLTAGITTEDTELDGYTDSIDFSHASLFALQFSGDVTDKVTATAQVVARGSNNYEADFEWAYLTYAHDNNSTYTIGRFRLPVFRYSDSLDVGYSYHWITAPQTVYDVAFNNLNGVRYDYSNYSGDLEYLFRFSYGNYEDEIAGGLNAGDDVVLISAEATYNSFKGRLVWGRGNNVFTSPTLDQSVSAFVNGVAQAVGGVDNIPAGVNALVDDILIEDDEGVFLGLGLEFDNFNWFVSGEWTSITLEDSFSPKDVAYYVTAGTRIGKWTPHITYQARDGEDDIKFQDRVASLPAPFQPGAAMFSGGLQTFFFEDYSLITIGARYDLMQNVALKFEVTKYDNKIEPQINPGDAVDTELLNFSVNYVF